MMKKIIWVSFNKGHGTYFFPAFALNLAPTIPATARSALGFFLAASTSSFIGLSFALIAPTGGVAGAGVGGLAGGVTGFRLFNASLTSDTASSASSASGASTGRIANGFLVSISSNNGSLS